MKPILYLEMDPPIQAELEYIYDSPVLPQALRGTLAHPPLAVWFIRKGRVQVSFNGSAPDLKGAPGDCLFLPAGLRSHHMTPETHLLSCRIHLRNPGGPLLWQQAHPFSLQSGLESLVQAGEQLNTISSRLFGHSSTHQFYPDPPTSSGSLEDMLLWNATFTEWLQEYLKQVQAHGWKLRTGRSARPVVDRTLALMKETGWQQGFKGRDLAEAFGISITHFKRRFRAETGQPFRLWLDRERLRRITMELETGDTPLKAISYSYGFSSPSHFSAWFRRQTGVAPRAYRATMDHVGI